MTKNIKRYFSIIAIIMVVYNLIVFLVPFSYKNPYAFWIAYSGGMFALLLQGYIAYLAFNKKETLKSALYGLPVVRVGLIYLLAQGISSLLIFVIGNFVEIPTWLVIIITAILLALALIGLIITESYKEEIIKMEKSEPLTTKFILDLRVDAKLLLDRYGDTLVKKELYELQQEIQYSDPKSSDSLLEIEDEINRKFVELKEKLINDEIDSSKKLINDLLNLIKERNYRCKMSKK